MIAIYTTLIIFLSLGYLATAIPPEKNECMDKAIPFYMNSILVCDFALWPIFVQNPKMCSLLRDKDEAYIAYRNSNGEGSTSNNGNGNNICEIPQGNNKVDDYSEDLFDKMLEGLINKVITETTTKNPELNDGFRRVIRAHRGK
uniref:Uncharacterized protein n=1 Tax=Steinernema glaseri TaxID=37863 RepID=A0A1I8AFT0_9BILA